MNDAEICSPGLPAAIDAAALLKFVREKRHVPTSTYRVQFHNGFGFRDAASIVAYLSRLGIDACYCSPYFQARPGTSHGYDICDHGRLHDELGGETDYGVFTSALSEAGMGQIVDFVPNHMAVDAVHNRWWRDVLENGPASPYARFFDIDWDPVKAELRGKVLLPVLEDHYGLLLERGEIRLAWNEGRFTVTHGPMHFPIDPKQYSHVLQYRLDDLTERLGEQHPDLATFRELLQAFYELPGCGEVDCGEERLRLKDDLLVRLDRLVVSSPQIARHIEENVRRYNGEPGVRDSFDLLHDFLEAQPYRLAYWKVAHDEINYRRFFHIQELGGLRMEDEAVFEATHRLLLKLVREGRVTGIRLDHLDGLFDPLKYLERFQDEVLFARAAERFGDDVIDSGSRESLRQWRRQQDRRSDHPVRCPLYLVAEKILAPQESLPADWPLHGSSGYDFMNDLNRLFVDSRHGEEMRDIYERFSGNRQRYEDVVEECKRLITRSVLASELKMLSRELNRICELDRRTRDYTLDSLREAIREVVVAFPVYRTYFDGLGIEPADREIVDRAVSRAMRRNPAMSPGVFSFLHEVLLLGGELSEEEQSRRLKFVMKFQQYTGPVEAKGVEDTAFYRYGVLLSLNEVGGKPDRFGDSIEAFHGANRTRRREWPSAMLATATHDNKRGEDVRARINVLSEIPGEWERHVSRWRQLHAAHRVDLDGESAPAAADEYVFYQTLLGAWPADLDIDPSQSVPDEFVERMREFLLKAVREANLHTSWMHPIDAYEGAVAGFVERTLNGPTSRDFLEDFLPFQRQVARWGMLNSLAQLVLKLVSPGVPDFYQGTELWDLNLVDPDNRRSVDYRHRNELLAQLEPLLVGDPSEDHTRGVGELLRRWPDGRIKLLITACGLRLRRQFPDLFRDGDYTALATNGPLREHVVAAVRSDGNRSVIAVAPRRVAKLIGPDFSLPIDPETWGDSALTLGASFVPTRWRNALTGEVLEVDTTAGGATFPLADVLRVLPVAILVSEA